MGSDRANAFQAIGSIAVVLIAQAALGPAAPAGGQVFADRAVASGLDFVHYNGMSGRFDFPEMTGQGGAFFDYDGDGDLDVYLVQGTVLEPGKTPSETLFPPRDPGPPRDRLLRNDLVNDATGSSRARFVDVTDASGLDARGYGMGVATGDFDNDGWVDIYVTNFGSNQLWRNRGDGTFEDVTASAGVDDPRWSTSALFADADGDGWLDLLVVNYVDYTVDNNIACYANSSRRDYCGPSAYGDEPDRLLLNNGDGTFRDVSTSSGLAAQPGAGLGAVAADLDGDGRVDLYVANDGIPNRLWLNAGPDANGDVVFRDDALLAGVAVNRRGEPEASMGVDAVDADGDGDLDLFMTHLSAETNTLYLNDGSGLFEDRSVETGLGAPSLAYTAFGTAWLDYDNDGLLDLLVANGAVKTLEPLATAGDLFPLDQPNQLFRNTGGAFEDVSASAGGELTRPEVSRGAAVGDVDNDGDGDVLLLNNNGPARLLINEVGAGQAWLGLRLTSDRGGGGRAAHGARVAVARTDGRGDSAPAVVRWVKTDGGYCSASDARVLVGLGAAPASAVDVRWPRGARQRLLAAPSNRYLVFRHREVSP